MPVRFGEFSLDRDRRLLLRGAETVPLTRKCFDFLDVLLTERRRALSKEQIRDRVWPRTVVSESTLNSLLGELREALGDDPRDPRYIRTVHGFGYAFVAEVLEDPAVPALPAGSDAVSPALLTSRLLWEERVIPLSLGENFLGRDDEVGIRVDAQTVSRRHARIVIAPGVPATIEDLGSKNGTWVGERRVEGGPVPLHDGDLVKLGTVEIVYLDSKETAATKTAG
jgi:DNA-binding winged helix-turn-helix (wHTH) protein